MTCNIGDISFAQFFKIYGEMLSGPPLLLVSNKDNVCWIPAVEMEILGIIGRVLSGLLVSDIVGIFVKLSFVNTDSK